MNTPLWIYIWRFQPFHNGHESVVEKMLQENTNNIIILGTLDTDNERNIYPPTWRQEAIQDVFPTLDIICLADNPDDSLWITHLKKILEKYEAHRYIFYCGDEKNDYAIQIIEKYKDILEWKDIKIQEVSRSTINVSGTQIRNMMKKSDKENIKKLVPKAVYSRL